MRGMRPGGRVARPVPRRVENGLESWGRRQVTRGTDLQQMLHERAAAVELGRGVECSRGSRLRLGGGIVFGFVMQLDAVNSLSVVEHADELMRAAAQAALAMGFAP